MCPPLPSSLTIAIIIIPDKNKIMFFQAHILYNQSSLGVNNHNNNTTEIFSRRREKEEYYSLETEVKKEGSNKKLQEPLYPHYDLNVSM